MQNALPKLALVWFGQALRRRTSPIYIENGSSVAIVGVSPGLEMVQTAAPRRP